MPVTIYVLQCVKSRYYVGKTNRHVNERLADHFKDNGSEWTRMFKPIKMVEIIRNADEFDEDKITKKYMKTYGIDKVRGGTYTSIILPNYQIMSLERELCSASDLCFRCNRKGHFASSCYANTYSDGSHIDDDEDEDDCRSNTWCYRCGRGGHFANNCFAATHFNGERF